MAIATARSLVEILSRHALLEPDRLAELYRSLPSRPADPLVLAKELLHRGWLTPYQVNQIFNGRAADLVLDHYVLLEKLGEGGMGQVFKARERRLGRLVALKVLRKEHLAKPDAVRRFYQEIEAIARLSHPNIVHAYDAEQIGESHVFTMEFVEGIDLSRLVKKSGPLPVADACEYVRQAAVGLQHVHENGMVHRDVKPGNLMRADAGGVIKILDMGLARLLDDEAASRRTRLGIVVGTVDYMAPEQALNSRKADIRSDLYGLGCALYYLLTGRVPFPQPETTAKLLAHQSDEPAPVEELRPETPPAVAAVVRRLMAKRPEDRYQTPAELIAALTDLRPPDEAPAAKKVEPPPAAPPPAGPDSPAVRRRPPRRVGPWLAAGFLALLLTAGGVYLLWPGETPPTVDDTPPTHDTPADEGVTNSLGMRLVRVPAGEFFIGSPPGEPHQRADETPSHDVTITRPFYVSVHLVTVADFRAFVGATGHRTAAEKAGARQTWRNPGWPADDDTPVSCVSWDDARAFCDWLGRKEGKTYRLPTEAEWEYACRAGSTAAYSFGPDPNKLDEYAWHKGNSGGRAHPVGRHRPNAWGLFDMHGNLLEWCGDSYDARYYQKLHLEDPPGPAPGGRRVVRGGSWASPPAECRSACRASRDPGEHGNTLGFRVVLSSAD